MLGAAPSQAPALGSSGQQTAAAMATFLISENVAKELR
jgi:hypothetical protein